MALQSYVEQSDRAYKSGVANESIKAGTFVFNGGSGVRKADAQDGQDVDGLAIFSEEFLVGEDEDAIVDESYASGDRVKYAPFEGSAVVKARTVPETTSGVTSAPSISHETVVGVVDTSDANAPSAAGYLVEEGYTNDEDNDSTSTTFNRSNSNFVALGVAYRPGKQNNDTVTGYDTTFRLQLYGEPRT